ncbi:hypothetical protein ES319_A08G194800v1 [Gossypium barbadense]|uniref:CCT domain-containing protein n=2 Tax=Gossypium TaxID=3633 RepID=A0A2P5XIQ6_GOSBA|nr:hypothetical protein ES319_A08G194800v1 [Gossypium barbadense]PPS03180.1 hypothetical protein GOBAR_AA17467 [Gossypium barbadense]TYH07212.1 hypothetical protein ES288_A08G215200v1 [Gossypium darwinii]
MSDNISVPPDTFNEHFLFDLPLVPLYDSSSDYNLQSLMTQQNPIDESNCSDQLVSGSPLTDQLENLSLYQTTHFPSFSFDPNAANEYQSSSSLSFLAVKNEESLGDFDSAFNIDNVANYLQRSFSSNSFETKPNFSFQTAPNSLMEPQNFQGQTDFSLPENTFFATHMRKVSSTGDLENMRNVNDNQRSTIENSLIEEVPFKVGRYNPEERQERISKYRAKRNLRNFNKTIKYACRKTLADNRPRVRGRFTRNDDTVETPKLPCNSTRDEDEDELWALHEVEDEIMGRATFINSFSQQNQFPYHHGCF